MPARTKPRVGARSVTAAPKPSYRPDPASVELRDMLNAAALAFVTTEGLAAEEKYRTTLLEVIARGVIGVLETIEVAALAPRTGIEVRS